MEQLTQFAPFLLIVVIYFYDQTTTEKRKKNLKVIKSDIKSSLKVDFMVSSLQILQL
jgi:hypothetical protein